MDLINCTNGSVSGEKKKENKAKCGCNYSFVIGGLLWWVDDCHPHKGGFLWINQSGSVELTCMMVLFACLSLSAGCSKQTGGLIVSPWISSSFLSCMAH